MSEGQWLPSSLRPGPHTGGHLSCGLNLLVQCPPSVPLAQGVPGLGAEPPGRTAGVWLVVSYVVESPKPRGEVIPSWRREGGIIKALWAALNALLPF